MVTFWFILSKKRMETLMKCFDCNCVGYVVDKMYSNKHKNYVFLNKILIFKSSQQSSNHSEWVWPFQSSSNFKWNLSFIQCTKIWEHVAERIKILWGIQYSLSARFCWSRPSSSECVWKWDAAGNLGQLRLVSIFKDWFC